ITLKQIVFTLVIILGTLTVLYKGKFIVNWGDYLVLFTPNAPLASPLTTRA
ncbi:unnamed protein product, partial [marine sediment metagenome]